MRRMISSLDSVYSRTALSERAVANLRYLAETVNQRPIQPNAAQSNDPVVDAIVSRVVNRAAKLRGLVKIS